MSCFEKNEQYKNRVKPFAKGADKLLRKRSVGMCKSILMMFAGLGLCFISTGCASNSYDSRHPASSSRSGRSYKEHRAMNYRSLSTDKLYQACLRERPETSCRNRLGR